MKKDEIDYMRDLAHAQLNIDQKEGFKRFLEFQRAMFPWMETAQKREKDSHADALRKEVMRGPLMVAPQAQPDFRRRTVKRVEKTDLESEDRIYRRLGKTQLP